MAAAGAVVVGMAVVVGVAVDGGHRRSSVGSSPVRWLLLFRTMRRPMHRHRPMGRGGGVTPRSLITPTRRLAPAGSEPFSHGEPRPKLALKTFRKVHVLPLSARLALEPRALLRRVRHWRGRVWRARSRAAACVPKPDRGDSYSGTMGEACCSLDPARKVRREQLTDDGNVEITGRDLRERESHHSYPCKVPIPYPACYKSSVVMAYCRHHGGI